MKSVIILSLLFISTQSVYAQDLRPYGLTIVDEYDDKAAFVCNLSHTYANGKTVCSEVSLYKFWTFKTEELYRIKLTEGEKPEYHLPFLNSNTRAALERSKENQEKEPLHKGLMITFIPHLLIAHPIMQSFYMLKAPSMQGYINKMLSQMLDPDLSGYQQRISETKFAFILESIEKISEKIE